MTEGSETVMTRLRSSTREQHDRAENHRFQSALARGQLPRESYVVWLGQMLLLHGGLEAALRSAAATSESVRNVVKDYQYQQPYLEEDLQFFGVDTGTLEPSPSTAAFLSELQEDNVDPLALLGYHYVLEGSNNGSKFIAKGLGKVYGLQPGPGMRYLDPYGDEQRGRWMEFKQDMDAVGFDPEEQQRIVAAAQKMFDQIAAMSDDLAAQLEIE